MEIFLDGMLFTKSRKFGIPEDFFEVKRKRMNLENAKRMWNLYV